MAMSEEMEQDEIVDEIRKLRSIIETEHKAKKIGYYGLFPDGGLGFIAEFEPGTGIITLVGLEQFLEANFGRSVIVSTENSLKNEPQYLERVIWIW